MRPETPTSCPSCAHPPPTPSCLTPSSPRSYTRYYETEQELPSRAREQEREREKEKLLEDVVDEIFDMVKPKERAAITLKDLIDCKVGETVVGILTDVFAFLQYDQREQLMHSADPE